MSPTLNEVNFKLKLKVKKKESDIVPTFKTSFLIVKSLRL